MAIHKLQMHAEYVVTVKHIFVYELTTAFYTQFKVGPHSKNYSK